MYLRLECEVWESEYLLRGTGKVLHFTNIMLYKAIYETKNTVCYKYSGPFFLKYIDTDIFVNCNWVGTRWQ